MKKTLAVLTLFISATAFAGTKKPLRTQPVRIHVFAAGAEGDFVDVDSKAKQDSIKDLSKALSNKKAIELVQSPERAHIVVEIMSRGYEETGGSTLGRSVWGNLKTSANSAATVRVRFSAGPYSTEMIGRAGDEQLFSLWSTCAGQIAGQIDKWIDLNYDRLVGN